MANNPSQPTEGSILLSALKQKSADYGVGIEQLQINIQRAQQSLVATRGAKEAVDQLIFECEKAAADAETARRAAEDKEKPEARLLPTAE